MRRAREGQGCCTPSRDQSSRSRANPPPRRTSARASSSRMRPVPISAKPMYGAVYWIGINPERAALQTNFPTVSFLAFT